VSRSGRAGRRAGLGGLYAVVQHASTGGHPTPGDRQFVLWQALRVGTWSEREAVLMGLPARAQTTSRASSGPP